VAITASKLRDNVYRVLDEVLATGEPVEIERNGRRLFIVADAAPSRLSRLVRRVELVVGDSEELVHVDWSTAWSGAAP
jgi:hypothetical protein